MGQSGVLRVHAEANLETTREIYTVGQFGRVVVAFTRDNVHRNGCAEMLTSIAVGDDDHIDADGVVQTLLIDDVADRKRIAADQLPIEDEYGPLNLLKLGFLVHISFFSLGLFLIFTLILKNSNGSNLAFFIYEP